MMLDPVVETSKIPDHPRAPAHSSLLRQGLARVFVGNPVVKHLPN
jgi:hypothetical protein